MKKGDLVQYRHHGVGVVLGNTTAGKNQIHSHVDCYWFSLGVKTIMPIKVIRGSIISEKR